MLGQNLYILYTNLLEPLNSQSVASHLEDVLNLLNTASPNHHSLVHIVSVVKKYLYSSSNIKLITVAVISAGLYIIMCMYRSIPILLYYRVGVSSIMVITVIAWQAL